MKIGSSRSSITTDLCRQKDRPAARPATSPQRIAHATAGEAQASAPVAS
jgi:hypothetical protein